MPILRSVAGVARESSIRCSILVCDHDPSAADFIASMMSDSVGILGVCQQAEISETLRVAREGGGDVCAVFVSEDGLAEGCNGFQIAREIRRAQRNIPIFMRLDRRRYEDLADDERQLLAGGYHLSDRTLLQSHLEKSVYGLHFPCGLVDTLVRAGEDALGALLSNCALTALPPVVVFDDRLQTDFTAILPVNFAFGNGFVSFSVAEVDVLALVAHGHTALEKRQSDPQAINQLISEVMNLFWGRAREMVARQFRKPKVRDPVMVPMVIGHRRNYISFGKGVPKLCIRYLLAGESASALNCMVEFRVIFNNALSSHDFVIRSSFSRADRKGGHFESL